MLSSGMDMRQRGQIKNKLRSRCSIQIQPSQLVCWKISLKLVKTYRFRNTRTMMKMEIANQGN